MTAAVPALALALLAGQAAPAAATQTPVSPVTVPAPAAAEDPVALAQSLAVTYNQGCGDRIYGMYAEACNTLAAQLRKAQAAARRYEREHPPRK